MFSSFFSSPSGLWYSIRTRFVQVRCFGEGMRPRVRQSVRSAARSTTSGMSSFQALATAIAAQVGTGNIVGASGAILTGGPGAIFWMWVIAFFGMATIYAEATLAQDHPAASIRTARSTGGPVYYITTAFKGGFGKFLAGFFAVAIILALGFMGCMVQSNSIGSTFADRVRHPGLDRRHCARCPSAAFIFLGGVQPSRRRRGKDRAGHGGNLPRWARLDRARCAHPVHPRDRSA